MCLKSRDEECSADAAAGFPGYADSLAKYFETLRIANKSQHKDFSLSWRTRVDTTVPAESAANPALLSSPIQLKRTVSLFLFLSSSFYEDWLGAILSVLVLLPVFTHTHTKK